MQSQIIAQRQTVLEELVFEKLIVGLYILIKRLI